MKKILLFALTAVFAFSCVKNPSPVVDPDENFKDVIANMTTTSLYSVPVKEGYTTVVTYKGQILAVTSKAMDILVPKEAVQTKSDGDLTVYYKTGSTDVSSSYLWQTIAFEDSKVGDLDYNDLIIHAKYEKTDDNLMISVHPIAYGATKTIKLGFEWHQGAASDRVIVSNDCREDLFGGAEGFINTVKYNVHYSDFVKEIPISLPSSSEAVQIDWFIVVDGSVEIFAVNQSGYDCIDEGGMPYGFAITDAGNGAVNLPDDASQASATKAPYPSWNDVQALWQWPSEPIPAQYQDLPKMDMVYSSSSSSDFYLPAHKSYEGEVSFKNNKFYIEGTLTVSRFWSNYNGSTDIFVLPGGVLNIGSSDAIQWVHIYNYGGEVNFLNNTAHFSWGSSYMTDGTINMTSLIINDGARVFAGSAITVSELSSQSSSELFLGCCLYATSSVQLENNAKIFVNHYIETDNLTMKNESAIYLHSGSIVSAEKFESTNKTTIIECIGDGYSVLDFGTITDTQWNFTNLSGLIDIHYDNVPAPLVGVPDGVMVNGNTSIPATNCNPSFGVQGGQGGETATGDTGLCWWMFPMERVNINTCYNFSDWRSTGNFNFDLLPGAVVFDIFDEEPEQGEGRVYDM